jgi:hypothetical protein
LSVDAALAALLRTPTSLFQITPRFHQPYYPNNRNEEVSTRSALLLYENRQQRQMWTVKGNYLSADTVETELPSTGAGGGLGESTGGDSGIVAFKNRRQTFGIEPNAAFDITQRQHLQFKARYDDTSFSTQTQDQRDYRDYLGSAGWGYEVTQRGQLTFGGQASHYETKNNLNSANVYGARVEWNEKFTEVRRYYLRGGVDYVTAEAQTTPADPRLKDNSVAFNAGAGTMWKYRVTDLFIDAQYSVTPSALGFLVKRTEVRSTLARELSPRLTLNFGARASEDRQIGNTAQNVRRRRYATGSAGFLWAVTRSWFVRGEYDLIWQQLSDQPGSANSNRVFLTLIYEPLHQ